MIFYVPTCIILRSIRNMQERGKFKLHSLLTVYMETRLWIYALWRCPLWAHSHWEKVELNRADTWSRSSEIVSDRLANPHISHWFVQSVCIHFQVQCRERMCYIQQSCHMSRELQQCGPQFTCREVRTQQVGLHHTAGSEKIRKSYNMMLPSLFMTLTM